MPQGVFTQRDSQNRSSTTLDSVLFYKLLENGLKLMLDHKSSRGRDHGCFVVSITLHYAKHSGYKALIGRLVEPKWSIGSSVMLLKNFVVATMSCCGRDHAER